MRAVSIIHFHSHRIYNLISRINPLQNIRFGKKYFQPSLLIVYQWLYFSVLVLLSVYRIPYQILPSHCLHSYLYPCYMSSSSPIFSYEFPSSLECSYYTLLYSLVIRLIYKEDYIGPLYLDMPCS